MSDRLSVRSKRWAYKWRGQFLEQAPDIFKDHRQKDQAAASKATHIAESERLAGRLMLELKVEHPVDDLTGRHIKGYDFCEQLGTGGFGVVYRARQVTIDREVAVKVILPGHANHPEFIRRFEREAQIVARLEHPHIVPLFDFWREPNTAFLVMRYYPASLHSHLKHSGHLSLTATAHWLGQIASALEMAHRNRVIHRDLKPENILLDHDGNAFLGDFGIATIQGQTEPEKTQRGFSGSVQYAAPELLRSQPASVQSDLYSLAYVVHRALSGAPVVDDDDINRWINHHLFDPLPPNEHIPDAVFNVLLKATAKHPTDRFTGVQAFVAAFRDAVRGAHPIHITYDASSRIVLNPYKGLRAFEEHDAGDFFGREALIVRLLDRLRADTVFRRFLAVVGPSGSGKSSVVKAGLLPALRQGQMDYSQAWYYADLTPGGRPFEKLAVALLGIAVNAPPDMLEQLRSCPGGLRDLLNTILPPGQELLLVIDQFEELFTLTNESADITLFLESLYTAVTAPDSRMWIIITLRADFYDRPLMYGNFAQLVGARTEIVTPMSLPELERVILGPAERAGLRVEDRLMTAIIADVRGEPGALPLLQYTLTELFEHRENDTLTLEMYQASGGVLQALAKRAEEIYQSLPVRFQPLARQIFLRMVMVGDGAESTRRRVLFSELKALDTDSPALATILDSFGRHRLITFDHEPTTREPSVEIAHEALIKGWLRLSTWLEESRSDVRMQRLLGEACQEWINTGCRDDFLLTGGRLSQFEDWWARSNVALTRHEEEYLRLSASARNRQVAVALDTALISYSQLALYRDNNTDLAITLAIEATRLGALPQQEYHALSEAVYAPGTRRVFTGHADTVYQVRFHHDTGLLLSASGDHTARLWDVSSGAMLRQFVGHGAGVRDADFAPDGHTVATASFDGTARIWDAHTGETRHILTAHQGAVLALAFNPDGQQLATASADCSVCLWDTGTGELLRRLRPHDPTGAAYTDHAMAINAVCFCAAGRQLVSAGNDRRALLWDISTGSIIRELDLYNIIASVVTAPDDQTVFIGKLDGSVVAWDTETGAHRDAFQNHTGAVYSMAFSPDGQTVFTASQDKTVRLWNIKTGRETHCFVGHDGYVYGVACLPNGTQFVTASADKTLRLWDIQTDTTLRRIGRHDMGILQAVFNADGTLIASASRDTTIRLWDVRTGAVVRVLKTIDPPDNDRIAHCVDSVAFSRDGKKLLSGEHGGTIRLWDVETGAVIRTYPADTISESNESDHTVWHVIFSHDEKSIFTASFDTMISQWDTETSALLRQFRGHTHGVTHLALFRDDRRFLSCSWDGNIILWDVHSGAALQRYEQHADWVWMVRLSPDEKTFISASADNRAIIWDVDSARPVRVLEGHKDSVLAAVFSRDGQYVVTTGRDGVVILWDVQTGMLLRRYIESPGWIGWVRSIDYSPVDEVIATGNSDGMIHLWTVQTLVEMVEWARQNRYVRELTHEERERFRLIGLAHNHPTTLP